MRPASFLLLTLAACGHLPAPPAAGSRPASRYLALDGGPRFHLGSTPTAKDLEGFVRHFDAAAAAGETIARIHIHHGLPRSKEAAGVLDESWCRRWDEVFEAARVRGIHVLPVMTGWAQWNDGSTGSRWHNWDKNPYNRANGGPAEKPSDLYADTPCRRLYLDWLGRAVDRFRRHPNIFAWEVFTEVNLLTGSTVPAAVEFTELASAAVRRSDLRPVTVSLAGVRVWPELWASPAVDLVQIHPYPGRRRDSDLARAIAEVAPVVRAFGKPVLIGEEGLDPGPPGGTADAQPRAFVGYRQAIWTALTSGLANGGMFWWIAGYGKGSLDGACPGLSKPAADFARDLDVDAMKPVDVSVDRRIAATALGGAATVVVYLRDVHCIAPDWPSGELRDATVTIPWSGPGRATFIDPATLRTIGTASVSNGPLLLPPFREDLLVRIDASLR